MTQKNILYSSYKLKKVLCDKNNKKIGKKKFKIML